MPQCVAGIVNMPSYVADAHQPNHARVWLGE